MNSRFPLPLCWLRFGFTVAMCCLFLLTITQADIVPSLTGVFPIGQAWTLHGYGGGTVLYVPYSGNLSFAGTVVNYWEDPPCGLYPDCDQYYGGDIAGGGVTFDTFLEFSSTDVEYLQFAGTINGGSFSGDNHLGFSAFDTYTSERIDIAFAGVWSNGWVSNGSIDIEWVDGVDFIWWQSGTMNLVTYTPEPSTLALLGPGTLGLTAALWRMRRK